MRDARKTEARGEMGAAKSVEELQLELRHTYTLIEHLLTLNLFVDSVTLWGLSFVDVEPWAGLVVWGVRVLSAWLTLRRVKREMAFVERLQVEWQTASRIQGAGVPAHRWGSWFLPVEFQTAVLWCWAVMGALGVYEYLFAYV